MLTNFASSLNPVSCRPARCPPCRRCCQAAANYSSSPCPCDPDVVAHLHEWLNEQSEVEYEFVQVGEGYKVWRGLMVGGGHMQERLPRSRPCRHGHSGCPQVDGKSRRPPLRCSKLVRCSFPSLPSTPSPAQGALAIMDMAPACSIAVPLCLAIDGVHAQAGKP